MIQTATNIFQSKRLLEFGIDSETADMYYTNYANKPNGYTPYIGKVGIREDLIPAWSLAALMSLFPETMSGHTIIYRDKYIVNLKLIKNSHKWWIGYGGIIGVANPDLFTACINLIEQLVKQGYIKTKKKE